MNTLVNNIMTAMQGDEHLIIKHEIDEIVLALTCNLDDTRTLSYAKQHFPVFFDTRIKGFRSVVSAIETVSEEEQAKYLIPAKNSVIILESALNAFNDRMEKYLKNE